MSPAEPATLLAERIDIAAGIPAEIADYVSRSPSASEPLPARLLELAGVQAMFASLPHKNYEGHSFARLAMTMREAANALLDMASRSLAGGDGGNDELARCPFCGAAARLIEIDEGYAVECTWGPCGVSTPIQFSIKEDARPLLIERWNSRALTAIPTPWTSHVQLCIDELVRVINTAVGTLEMSGYAFSAQNARGARDEALALLSAAPLSIAIGHLIDGEFQSDKYPTTPRGKVPLSVKDTTAQDLLWEYAQRRRAVDADFAADLEEALRIAGFVSPPPESEDGPT